MPVTIHVLGICVSTARMQHHTKLSCSDVIMQNGSYFYHIPAFVIFPEGK